MKYKGDPRRRRGHLPASFSASAYASFFFAPSSDAARLDASLEDCVASRILVIFFFAIQNNERKLNPDL